MSAFLVSEEHIDAMVSVALFGVAEASAVSGKWARGIYFGNPSVRVDVNTANRLGAMLALENENSIRARYPTQRVRPADYSYPFDKLPVPLFSIVAALKLVQCYEYQSCEHDGWDSSRAKTFCESLKGALIASLPGYDDAPWGI